MRPTPAVLSARLAIASTAAIAGVVLLTGCAASPAPSYPAAATSTSTSQAATSPATSPPTPAATTSSATVAGSAPDALTPNQRYQLLTILEAVNPGVSTDQTALVNASFTVCTHIKAHDSTAAVEALISDQFSNGPYRPSPEEAQAIDMAIAKTFCFG